MEIPSLYFQLYANNYLLDYRVAYSFWLFRILSFLIILPEIMCVTYFLFWLRKRRYLRNCRKLLEYVISWLQGPSGYKIWVELLTMRGKFIYFCVSISTQIYDFNICTSSLKLHLSEAGDAFALPCVLWQQLDRNVLRNNLSLD